MIETKHHNIQHENFFSPTMIRLCTSKLSFLPSFSASWEIAFWRMLLACIMGERRVGKHEKRENKLLIGLSGNAGAG
ncbi:hypothetical protein KC356_g345 [Hortaea werneckii]|nr:hypothetical protein KC356_g345 [Hortaea werneckii]